uniref:Hydrophobic W protein n=1 Tax=Acidicaldus sp. TaxID=1872105 RepID=A0A8J4M6I8_9PROT
MSEAAPPRPSALAPSQKMFSELRVSGHLMTLETGLFCIVQTPGQRRVEDGSGLPGVRISLAPGPLGRQQAVSISTFRPDGWLSGASDAALVRVTEGPAQVLVTIYQAPGGPENAPRLQVLRLAEEPGAARPGAPAAAIPPAPAQRAPALAPVSAGGPAGPAASPFPAREGVEIMAHVQMRGDIGAMLGEWVGERGSKRWIEGFVMVPRGEVSARDIEYQAVLGRGWLSPWVEGGQLCGSRGMALPLLGVRIRLRGPAAETHTCTYTATFVDGTTIGPVGDGGACEAESMAPLEAFQIVIQRRPQAAAATASETGARKPRPAPPAPSPTRGKAAKTKPAPARRGR